VRRHLRIAAADDEANMQDYLRELLPRLGHEAIVARSGRQLLELCRMSAPDLIITDIKMDDMDGLEAAEAINRELSVPVILVSAHNDDDLRSRALRDHVMAYLAKPVKQADLENAIEMAMMRFAHFCALRQEASDLRQALEDRKLVERAKGIVMRRLAVDEEDAFRRLRKIASVHNHKLTEVARAVLTSEEIFTALEHGGAPAPAGERARSAADRRSPGKG